MKKIWIFGSSIIITFIIIFIFSLKNYNSTIIASICSEDELSKMKQNLFYDVELEVQLLFDGYEIPYDVSNNTYYLPVTNEFSMYEEKIHLLDSTQKLFWEEDAYMLKIDSAVSENHAFTIYIANDEHYKESSIVFTRLPMMSLNYVEDPIGIVNCRMDLFDPISKNGQLVITRSYAYQELRGQTSRQFPKPNYNLNLYTDKFAPNDESLLGMREDDDWKLNALYTDKSKVREMVATTLWSDISNSTASPYDKGFQMQYMELMMDGQYRGIYGLMEQMDFKQLSLNKHQDILYKGVSFITDENRTQENLNLQTEYCGQMIKTGSQTLSEELWKPFVEYLETMSYFSRADMKGTETSIYEYIDQHMNIENLLNTELYIQAIYGVDNAYKNQYVAAVLDDKGSYVLWKTPWDLNYCFGDVYDDENDRLTSFSMESYTKTMNKYMLTEQLFNIGNKEFDDCLQAQWRKLRNSILNTEYVRELTTDYISLLNTSGAFEREQEKWPESLETGSEKEMLKYFDLRLEFLDEHYLIK